jgi:hypothetical protein
MECKHCGREFKLLPGKPGLINECPECATETVEKKAGIVYWEGKHTPVLVITDQANATNYAKANRRIGAGVMNALTPHRAETVNPGTKEGTGAGMNDSYSTDLNEKRRVWSLKRKKN